MKKINIIIALVLFFKCSYAGDLYPPHQYVLDKLKTHDIVFLGTTHKQKKILTFIAGLLPDLHSVGVTYIALEIATDQQQSIDEYINKGHNLKSVKRIPVEQ